MGWKHPLSKLQKQNFRKCAPLFCPWALIFFICSKNVSITGWQRGERSCADRFLPGGASEDKCDRDQYVPSTSIISGRVDPFTSPSFYLFTTFISEVKQMLHMYKYVLNTLFDKIYSRKHIEMSCLDIISWL